MSDFNVNVKSRGIIGLLYTIICQTNDVKWQLSYIVAMPPCRPFANME